MDAEQILRDLGAVIRHGHFILRSGLHSAEYVNKAAIYRYPKKTLELGTLLAEMFLSRDIDVVLGPATGGAILTQAVALGLNSRLRFRREVEAAYADKDGDGFVIQRGFEEVVRGRRILLVDDVVTTGSSMKDVIAALRPYQAVIVGLGAICNRGGVKAEVVGVNEIRALVGTTIETWTPDKCPMCKRGTSINTSVGHGLKKASG